MHDHDERHEPEASEVEEEQIHFANVVTAFQGYAQYSFSANNRRRKDFLSLPKADKELIASLGYHKKLDQVDDAIVANSDFLSWVVADPQIFGHDLDEDGIEDKSTSHSHAHASPGDTHSHTHDHTHGKPRRRYKPTDFDMEKLRSTLKQFVRDWSVEGRDEREACYAPMRDALLKRFADVPQRERGKIRVLVPGAGLGRLAHDIASLGFTSQGNEFSHYMLLASHFILNRTSEVEAYTIYPYVHSFSNVTSDSDMLRPIRIPDILPSSLPSGVDFSYVAGDFEEIYGDESAKGSQARQWDAVLTCFFIDTAKNIVSYLRIIHRILKPGGVWINMGPLLWHWENNNTNDLSIELSLEEVKNLARAIGFKISDERTIDTTYTNNKEGMLGYVYHAAFWVATKEA
ncbi:N2227-domain-containing protein [Roridomyces roridus]|uniref:carnosine N-methyltransferase n=1 Tax=Roridomyces roridus TaxID=1738132 RepID=A0AAD7G319_9AGAR|nr:N2227-domain-containing protein [Roridomyces roridus]